MTRDITNQIFGTLTAISPTQNRASNGSVMWQCKCSCGNTCEKSVSELNKLTKLKNPTCGSAHNAFNLTTDDTSVDASASDTTLISEQMNSKIDTTPTENIEPVVDFKTDNKDENSKNNTPENRYKKKFLSEWDNSVEYNEKTHKWDVFICYNNKTRMIGSFPSSVLAYQHLANSENKLFHLFRGRWVFGKNAKDSVREMILDNRT